MPYITPFRGRMALFAAARADPLAAALAGLPRVRERRLGHDEVRDLAVASVATRVGRLWGGTGDL